MPLFDTIGEPGGKETDRGTFLDSKEILQRIAVRVVIITQVLHIIRRGFIIAVPKPVADRRDGRTRLIHADGKRVPGRVDLAGPQMRLTDPGS